MMLTPSRRAFLAGGAGAAACITLRVPASGQAVASSAGAGLRILSAKPAAASPGSQGPSQSPEWGYDGSVPGPLLRVRQGDEIKIRLVNELAAATAIHWHGIRAPNTMDGVPYLTQSPVETNAVFEYRFRAPDAGTFWYHAPSTLPGQIERGLYGVLIVDEKTPVEVDRDIGLVFDERLLPAENVTTRSNERLRFRLINAAKARRLSLRFDRHAVRVMAVDGQPAEPFLAHESHVSLGPGNRIDVFLDAALEPGATASIFLDDSGREKGVARLIYDGAEKRRASPLPDPRPLPANPLPGRIDLRNALRVEAPLQGADSQKPIWTTIAPSPAQFGPALFSVKRGRAVALAFPNQTDAAYAIHLHGHHVRLLDNLDDGWKPFWFDTLIAGPRRTTRIAFVADNPGKWLLHAQSLADREPGMTAWFEVS